MIVGHLSRDEIQSIQLKKLRNLVPKVSSQNPFYRHKLHGTSASFSKFSSFSEYSSEIPFTIKEELIEDQTAFPPFGSNLTYPIEHYTRYSQTSGTTGHPLRWLDTRNDWDSMIRNWMIVYQAAEITSKDRLFIPFSFGPFLGFWTAFEAAAHLGCLCIPGGGLTTLGRIKSIIENKINIICCTPTYAIRLGLVALEEKIDLSKAKVKSIVVAGEMGGSLPKTRKRIQRLWHGANVIDHHGMTEIGPASYQCPACPGILHIIESAYYAEVVGYESSQRASSKSSGELIVTTLDRIGSPVIRYRTGDLVQVRKNQRCACGSDELSLEGGILGRFDDMVSVRGVNIFPSAIDNTIRSFDPVNEYRVESRLKQGMVELLIQVEIDPTFSDSKHLCIEIERAISNALSIRIPVKQVAHGTLPQFETKAKRWVRF